MTKKLRLVAACLAALMLVFNGAAFADPQGKAKPRNEQKQKVKGPKKHMSGKNLVGDKLKVNGSHKIHSRGKFSSVVNVSKGKIAGVNVKHADKGNVKVTKYKSKKKMASIPAAGDVVFASQAFAQEIYVELWIGYGYYDDYYDEEVIYWFPIDWILDGDYGAVDYDYYYY